MKSVQRKFNNIKKNNPCWSSYICFAETVSNQNFSKKIIRKYFRKLIDKKDYLQAEKKEVLNYLLQIKKDS